MLTLRSPAKVNLFLRVLARRNDGYHELASLFQTVNLFDSISIEKSDQDVLTCTDSNIPIDSSNLIWKAIQAFRLQTGIIFPVRIHLEKNIPVQAGLGGGSSNAATALQGINQLSGNVLKRDDLSHIGTQVGSDVPFFLCGGTAYCTGRGEVVETVKLPEGVLNEGFYIVKPPFGLSTPKVYQALEVNSLPKRCPKETLEGFLSGKCTFYNDLETAAFKIEPELAILRKELLQAGFSEVVMTGSGACLCCYGPGKVPKGMQSYYVHFSTQSNVGLRK